jgi:TPP-dependent pyruvate/acetoin dehydrogenase alpha subunit
LPADAVEAVRRRVAAEVDQAVERARQSPLPDGSELLDGIYAKAASQTS